MNGRIEWDVAADPLRACLMVEVKERGLLRPATLEDLRKACEAVGLHVVDRGAFAAIVANGEHAALRATNLNNDLHGLRAHRNTLESEVSTLRAQLAAALTSPEGRATNEELRTIYANAATLAEGVLAVAARVRRERGGCLVERLLAEKCDFEAWERESDATWTVRVIQPGTNYTTTVTDVPAADVPKTLARLAGLDGVR